MSEQPVLQNWMWYQKDQRKNSLRQHPEEKTFRRPTYLISIHVGKKPELIIIQALKVIDCGWEVTRP
jgi:hypothetical protein